MIQCNSCRASLPDNAKFCTDCGQTLIAQSDASTVRSNYEKTPTQPLSAYNNAHQTTSAPSDIGTVPSSYENTPTQPLLAHPNQIKLDHQFNDANAFDILLQFDQTTMQDLQTRSLNTSLAT